MQICIIETGLPPEECIPEFGQYPQMIEDWLKPFLTQADFSVISIVNGEKLPLDASKFDAYIITGSKHGVYVKLEWIASLEKFLRDLRDKNIPIFGICFGHQIMAQAYGGKVEKSDKGWGLGSQSYRFDDNDYSVLVLHQDQVLTAPEGAKVLAGNNFCPLGSLQYDFPAMSVQFHPEFTSDYLKDLATRFRGSRFPEDIVDKALNGLNEQKATSQMIAKQVASLFTQTRN